VVARAGLAPSPAGGLGAGRHALATFAAATAPMTRDEFVTFHGAEAWDRLVKSQQDLMRDFPCDCLYCYSVASNANAIAHYDVVMTVLSLLGFKGVGLVEARAILERLKDRP
jgi:hypothetical protein